METYPRSKDISTNNLNPTTRYSLIVNPHYVMAYKSDEVRNSFCTPVYPYVLILLPLGFCYIFIMTLFYYIWHVIYGRELLCNFLSKTI